MDTHTTIKKLYSENMPIKKIAATLGISKNTVKKYLRTDTLPQYTVTPPGTCNGEQAALIPANKSEWHEWHNQIIEMYYSKRLIGKRIFNELKLQGAKGSRAGFYEYFKGIRASDVAEKARERYETGPGKQSQFDWSEYTVPIGSELRKIYVFLVILSYSRYRHATGSFDATQASQFEAKERAWRYFDGTTEEELTDNARQMVDNANRKSFTWNAKYYSFMSHYGIVPKACKVRHAWTKGKVENPFRYLENHFIAGNTFASLEDFNARLESFCEQVNNSHHEGIAGIPYEKYLEEKTLLQALPATAFVHTKELWRKVGNDCMVDVDGTPYSVPHPYAFKYVWIRKSLGNRLVIFSQKGTIIAEHEISSKKGVPVIVQAHFDGLRTTKPDTVDSQRRRFLELFPGHDLFLEKISAVNRRGWRRDVQRIIELSMIYSADDIAQAIQFAHNRNLYSYRIIYAFVTSQFDIEERPLIIHHHLLPEMDGIKRDLKEYEQLLPLEY